MSWTSMKMSEKEMNTISRLKVFGQRVTYQYEWYAYAFRMQALHRRYPFEVTEREVQQAFEDLQVVLQARPLPQWVSFLVRECAWSLAPMVAPFGRAL
ncbi:MAG: hypothetical protein JAZ11_02820 [Candidatus Thiodiazotropha lotti]|nr:hypothetical protein [Candidatus Thiodiazotropha lotti]